MGTLQTLCHQRYLVDSESGSDASLALGSGSGRCSADRTGPTAARGSQRGSSAAFLLKKPTGPGGPPEGFADSANHPAVGCAELGSAL